MDDDWKVVSHKKFRKCSKQNSQVKNIENIYEYNLPTPLTYKCKKVEFE